MLEMDYKNLVLRMLRKYELFLLALFDDGFLLLFLLLFFLLFFPFFLFFRFLLWFHQRGEWKLERVALIA